MGNYFEILSQCPLFDSIKQPDLEKMLKCLDVKTVEISKSCPVFLEGSPARFVGVVLSGSIQIVQNDYYGNQSVLDVLHPGELFAEVFSCAGLEAMPVSAIALKNSHVLLLDCKRVLNMCSNVCQFHNQLLNNLLHEIAKKNLILNKKIRFLSQKKTKDKLMAYLLDQAKQHGRPDFTIPYDRQTLADYLGVERSAMSAEISKLKKAGQIDTKGSWFCLKHV